MTLYDAAIYSAVALLVAAVFIVPRRVSLRHRVLVGGFLFIVGWAGIFGGLAMGDQPFLQSEAAALAWMGGFALLLVLSAVMLVTAATEGWRLKSGSRKRP